jgi:Flp pilus assembly pilin Flp
MFDLAKRFAKEVLAANSLEYGLIAAGILIAIVMAVSSLGSDAAGQ